MDRPAGSRGLGTATGPRPRQPAPHLHRGPALFADPWPADLAARVGWTLAWLAVLTGGASLWGSWTVAPAFTPLGPVFVAAGIAGTVLCWTRPPTPGLDRAGLIAALLTFGLSGVALIAIRGGYSTDAAAFNQYAAHLLLHGRDPYTASMAPASHLFHVPRRYWTYELNGAHVTRLSYPAGSFLLYVPLVAAGLTRRVVDVVDLLAWVASGVLMYRWFPRRLRWAAALLVLAPIYLGLFTSGGTDALFIPLLLVAVRRWDRFADPLERTSARWIGPVALGLACTVKQTPWFCVPFLVLGLTLEARRSGRSLRSGPGRYLAVLLSVFAIVNLPFIVWDPAAWAHGSLTPFVDPLIADGQGLVTVATHGLTGGVNLSVLTAAAALVYLVTVAAFVLWYGRLKPAWLLLLPVTFFFSTRSFASYLVDLAPAAVLMLLTVAPGTSPALRRRRRIGLVAGPAAVAAALAAVAFLLAPLTVRIDHVRAAAGELTALTVTLHNGTGSTVYPSVGVDTGSNIYGYWRPLAGGRLTLPPHATRTVTLVPPVATNAPQRNSAWLVLVYTGAPKALSTSPLQTWTGNR